MNGGSFDEQWSAFLMSVLMIGSVLGGAWLTVGAAVAQPSSIPGECAAAAPSDVPRDQFEPNDEWANATQIEPGTYTGLHTSSSDYDLFILDDLETGDTISIEVSSDRSSQHSLQVNYPDKNTGELRTVNKSGGSETVSVTKTLDRVRYKNENLTDGAVYIAVWSDSPSEYDLDLSVEPADRFEPNDEWANATQIDPGTYTGLRTSSSDYDLFILDDLETGDTISIEASSDRSSQHFLRVHYPDRNTGEHRNITKSGGAETVSVTKTLDRVRYKNENLTDGAVYIAVWSDSPSEYDLDLSVETPDPDVPADRFEPNEEYENAPVMRPGDYSLTHSGVNDTDWHRVPVDQGETVTVESDVPVTLYYPGPDGNSEVVPLPDGGPQSQRVAATKYADIDLEDGYVYLISSGDNRRYSLDVTVEGQEPNEPPSVDPLVAETPTNTTTATNLDIRQAETVTFRVRATDPDWNLRAVRWFVNGDQISRTAVNGSWARANVSYTFDEPGQYTVAGGAVDAANATSSIVTWDVVVWPRQSELSMTIRRVNNRTAGENGYRLQSNEVRNVTIRLTDGSGEPVINDDLNLTLEDTSINDAREEEPLTHLGNGIYRAEGIYSLAYTQRLRFDVVTTEHSELRTEPVTPTHASAHALVTTQYDLLNAPIPGWVFAGDREDVYVDGTYYIALKMARDGEYDHDVTGKPETAWLVFNRDGHLIRDTDIRRKAALTAAVASNAYDVDREDVQRLEERIPSIANQAIRTGEGLEFLTVARDTTAELGGSLIGAAATGGSNILAKHSAKQASKAFARKFATDLLENYISQEVAPDNPLGALEQGLEMKANAELRESAAESKEAGRILSRHRGDDIWKYSDAHRYRSSRREATIDLVFYLEVRSELLPDTSPQAQLESIVANAATGLSGAPIDNFVALLNSGELDYISEAKEETARLRALHRLENRSFGTYSREVQQTALDRYDDRVLIGPRLDDARDEIRQSQNNNTNTNSNSNSGTTQNQEPGSDSSTNTVTGNATATATPSTPTGQANGTDTDTIDNASNDPEQSTGRASGPGFGVAVVVVALIATALLASRRTE